MHSTNRSRTPASSGDALFDCSKIIKPKDARTASSSRNRNLTPVPRAEVSSSSAPSGGHRPYSSRGRQEREKTPSGVRMRGAPSLPTSGKSSSAPKTESKSEATPRPKCLSEKRSVVISGARRRSVCNRIWSFFRALLLVAVIVVCAAAIYMVEWTRPASYCDTRESGEGCAPCPENGECTNGTVRCDEGFEEHRQKCVKDRNLEARAKLWLENLEHHLAYLQGLAKCYDEETGMLDEYDVRQYLANTYGGTYLEETFAHMKKILPVTIRRTGTVFDTTRVHIPISCRIEHAFWLYVPPIILLMFILVLIHWLYTYRQRKNEAYALVKQFIESQTTIEPRLSGPTCADVTQYGASIGIEEAQCRAILHRITQKETSIRSSPDPFRGNALIYWSQRVAATVNHLRARGRTPILA